MATDCKSVASVECYMEITWYGHTCFRLKERKVTVVTDPYDKTLGLPMPRLKADIITASYPSDYLTDNPEMTKNGFQVIDSPGEYEIAEIFVTAIYMPPKKQNQQTSIRRNVFVIYMDEIAVCHLGMLDHVPTQSQVEKFGSIDVLLIPVGGGESLNATQAAEVISLVEPHIVIPMYYSLPKLTIELDPVSKFLKEMGLTKVDPIDTLKLTKSNLPEETQIVLLEAKS